MKPVIDRDISPDDFINRYWLKTDLIAFCRKNGLYSSGGKKELENRIYYYLNTGLKLLPDNKRVKKTINKNQPITLKTKLEETYKNDKENREFFKSVIGERFKFNVIFMKWVKLNSEKTYHDAVKEWLRIEEEKKSGKKYKIGPQFEYNQYTRDFFIANNDKSKADAIKCWKYKKSIPGSNKYEPSDLVALK